MFEEELIPGAMLTARIPSSSPYRPPLLKREIAESLPLSSKNFTDIVAMFAPASLTMLDDIKFTQAVCEDPRHVKGETKACAPSVESMVDMATSILGTRDVRAMSSDVPVEGVPARRYRLAAVRRATESQKMVTCHGMRYPYAVFMCHSIYPSRSYYVTLAAGDGSPPTEALVMCHLDTSSWAPNHYFFQFTGAKPGEKAACHFVNRGTIVWAPNGKQGEAQAAE